MTESSVRSTASSAAGSPVRSTCCNKYMGGSEPVSAASSVYLSILVFSAPFGLANYVILGWFLGLGKAGTGLLLQVLLNSLNIVLNVTFVLGLGWGIAGVAWGTVIGEVVTAFIGLALVLRHAGYGNWPTFAVITDWTQFKRLAALNGDIMLMNLVSASNAQDPAVLWGFISRYAADATPQSHPDLDKLVGYAIRYFEDFVKPGKVFRTATDLEQAALRDLDARLQALPADQYADGEAIQSLVYDVGKSHAFENLRDWFKALYQILLGQDQGPRFGSFIALYGVAETRELIAKGLAGELL